MKHSRWSQARVGISLVAVGCLLSFQSARAASAVVAKPLPNVIFIMADDLGYAELGCYGQEKIRTPYIDQLAREGVRFTRHYAGNAVCAPSRCVLMTGLHPGHAWIRSNSEVKPEGQKPLPAGTLTMGRAFQQQGYVTAAMGKWGLGPPASDGDPLNQGFNHFFGYNCQRQAHNYYPTYLWEDDHHVTLNNPVISPYQKLAPGADPNSPESYRAFQGSDYAPDRINAAAREFVRTNRDRPFFLYLPTTVPHLALQVPDDSLKEYLGQWPDPPYPGGHGYLAQYAPRAAYAAMVTRMDREIGRLMTLVRELGLEEQTIFVFTSDNGPTYDRLGGSDSDFFKSADGMRGLKGSLYEGGIRVPAIVRWKGHLEGGRVVDRLSGFEDWLPTLLELIGRKTAIPAKIDGISFAPALRGQRQAPRPFLYREFPSYGGQQAVWLGDWKGIRQNLRPPRRSQQAPNYHIELYNLRQDLAESRDVSADHPKLVRKLAAIMRAEHTPAPEFPFPALDHPPERISQ